MSVVPVLLAQGISDNYSNHKSNYFAGGLLRREAFRPGGHLIGTEPALLLSQEPAERIAMRSKGFEGMVCSIAGVLDALGDRWAVLILRDISLGLSKYEDFRKSTGITHATLSDRLKHLEANELIERRRYQTNPERFEYLLTGKGRDIILVIQALAQVGDKWKIASKAGPPLRFVDRNSGGTLKLALVDEKTGKRVRSRDVQPQEGPGADDLVRWRLTKFKE
jgi:DNA-binding HxlR family transcriptional regulator